MSRTNKTWVTVSDENGNIATVGAARLNIIDKEVFAITDFVTKDQMLEDPSVVEKIFPLMLHKRILELVGL